MKIVLLLMLPLLLSGCWIESYDNVGSSARIKIGGIISYIVDIDISGQVGLTRNNGVTNDDVQKDDGNSNYGSWL